VEDALKIGVYVLLVLPGFILVQTREYHLLREKGSQFEKTLEIILWSAAIWIIACASPIWWPSNPRSFALYEARAALQDSAGDVSVDSHKLLNHRCCSVHALSTFYRKSQNKGERTECVARVSLNPLPLFQRRGKGEGFLVALQYLFSVQASSETRRRANR
jgi:hypothetical protein